MILTLFVADFTAVTIEDALKEDSVFWEVPWKEDVALWLRKRCLDEERVLLEVS